MPTSYGEYDPDDLLPPAPSGNAFSRSAAGAAGEGENSVYGAVAPIMRTALMPSPMLDMSNTLLPSDPRELYRVCRMLSVVSPLHKTYVHNIARLAISDLKVTAKGSSSEVTRKAREASHGLGVDSETSEDLKIEEFKTKLGQLKVLEAIREHVASLLRYDVAITIMVNPFRKMLQCTRCGYNVRAELLPEDDWHVYSRTGFKHKCPQCGHHSRSVATDSKLQDLDSVRFRTIDPERIRTMPNEITGEIWFYYEVPRTVEELLSNHELDKTFILTYPQPYLEAIFNADRKRVHGSGPVLRLRREQMFVSTTSSQVLGKNGLPIPQFTASAPDAWTGRLMQKANAVNASANIYPLHILAPDTASNRSIYETIDAANYMAKLSNIFVEHRKDPNFKAVAPFPVVSTTVGGDAKAVMMHAEIRSQVEMTAAGLGQAIEFFFGGLSYSGSSVSIKVLMQFLKTMRDDGNRFLQWIIERLNAMYLQNREFIVKVCDPDLGEDLQKLQVYSGLAQNQQIGLHHLDTILGTNRVVEQRAIRGDVEFAISLAGRQMSAETEQRAQQIITEGLSQSRGAITASLGSIEAKQHAARAVRGNADLMNTTLANPMEAAAILGTNSQELMAPAANALPPVDPRFPVQLPAAAYGEPALYGTAPASAGVPLHVQEKLLAQHQLESVPPDAEEDVFQYAQGLDEPPPADSSDFDYM